MIGLVFSQVLLFLAAGLLGFGAGYALRAQPARLRAEEIRHDIEILRKALSEAQVRRARG
jgi:hypothetical protein